MCGITGYIDFAQKSDLAVLKSMVQVLNHRGPDAHGYYCNDTENYRLGFGHTRLSIIDLSENGNQPIHYLNYSIVFNGEVYNYKEIKFILVNLGHKFKSDSDTEVVLHAFVEWGEACVNRFIGMFVFVIYDREQHTVHSCRDRAGVKPFYYYWNQDLFLFGSELKALMAHPLFVREIDREALSNYFQYGYVAAPLAIFKHTLKLMPGTWLKINMQSKKITQYKYWKIQDVYSKEKFQGSYKDATQKLDQLLQSAIDYRMVSDVPVGVFLSGGYDSTLVTAKLKNTRQEKIKTFTIGFNEGNDEASHARKVAEYLETEHHEIICTESEAKELIDKLPYFYDEPFSDSSAIPTMLVSSFAKQSVGVALSADGGDELLAGYDRYGMFLDHLLKFRKIPARLSTVVGQIIEWNTSLGFMGNGARRKKAESLAFALQKEDHFSKASSIFKWMNSAPSFYLKQLLKSYKSDVVVGFDLSADFKSDLDIALCNDYYMYLQNDILTKVDRATMSVSLEGREPLLDHRLVEFTATLPDHFKRDGKGGKKILKDLVHQYVPMEIMDRPKSGFSITIDKWLKNDLSYLLDEFLCDTEIDESLFSLKYVRFLRKKFQNGDLYFKVIIWRLVVFQMWKKKWNV